MVVESCGFSHEALCLGIEELDTTGSIRIGIIMGIR
jgi:hypothetical protein